MIGLCGLLVITAACILAPVLTPYEFQELDLANIKSGPSLLHPLGTDTLGRDYLTRLLYGGRYSLALGVVGSIFSFVIGVFFGSLAGYFGGAVDAVLMRICDVLQSIPPTMISIVISMALGDGYFVTILALALGGCTNGIRMTRGQILKTRKDEYLEAARSINCSTARIIFKHTLPNVISPMLLGFTMGIGGMIQVAANLSVLGLGVQPPTPEWGQMLSAGLNYIKSYPHLILFPGLLIFAVTLLINLFGDGLRDAIDPKLKR